MSEAKTAGQLGLTWYSNVKIRIGVLSGITCTKFACLINYAILKSHPLGSGGFDVLNPPLPRGGIFDFETPRAPGVGDLRFGAPHANTSQ